MASSASNGGTHTHYIRSNLNGLEDLFSFLVAVPEALEDQNARIEGLDERIEEGLDTVEDLERAYESLLANLQEAEAELDEQQAEVEALRAEVDDLRDDLDALRGLFSGRVLDKEDAHVNAQRRDATDIVDVGDTRTVVVDDTDYDDPRDPKAVAHIEGLVTFVPAPEKDLTEGDEVEVRISDVGENHAHAVRIEG
jgi:predicted RNA-binding protein with TRAM domain